LVFITHGWNSDLKEDNGEDAWPTLLKKAIEELTQDDRKVAWTVLAHPWPAESGKVIDGKCPVGKTLLSPLVPGCFYPWDAYTRARTIGEYVGKLLLKGQYDYIHFIAHSAGSNLIQTAVDTIHEDTSQPKKPEIHSTFLDAYEPNGNISRYGPYSKWAEHYVDMRESPVQSEFEILDDTYFLLQNAFNFDVTDLDPDGKLDTVIQAHAWPYQFYQETVGSSSGIGFPLALESGTASLPSNQNQYPRGGDCTLSKKNPVCSVSGGRVRDSVLELTCTNLLSCTLQLVKSSVGKVTTTTKDLISFVTGLIPKARLKAAAQAQSQGEVWSVMHLNIGKPIDTLKFDYRFKAKSAQGFLSVFLDDQVVYKADQRTDGTTLQHSGTVPLGEVAPGIHTLSFRLDTFNAQKATLDVSKIQTGNYKSSRTCQGKDVTLVGAAKNDKITGTAGDDVIDGLGGNDTIKGLGGNDLLCGGSGNDNLNGGAGNDALDGGSGTDTCNAGETVKNCP
jgi:hypothetical protein